MNETSQPDSGAAAAQQAESGKRTWLPALLLALAVLFAYGTVFENGFAYDDLALLERNPTIASMGAAFANVGAPHWSFEDSSEEAYGNYWRPLSLVTFAFARSLGAAQPWAFHALSILLHIIATWMCWRFARRLLDNSTFGFLSALLFGLHPLHVESVAWASAVNDPLFAIFAFASLNAFIDWRRAGSRGVCRASALYLLIALLAKEHALVVVGLVIVFDYALLRDVRAGRTAPKQLAQAYGGFALVLSLYYLARVFVFESASAGLLLGTPLFTPGIARASSYRIELFGGFLRLLTWPLGLTVFRPFRPELPPLDYQFHSALLLAIVWGYGLMRAKRAGCALSVTLLLALPVAVAPVLVNWQVAGENPLSDRYLYLATAAWSTLVVLLAVRWLPRKLAYAALGLVALLYGLQTHRQAQTWRDNETFFRHSVAASPDSASAHWGLGRELLERYKDEREKIQLDEALLEFLTSLAIGMDYGEYAAKLGPEATVAERLDEMQTVINRSPPEARTPDLTVWVTPFDRLQANLGQGWCYLYASELPPEYDNDTPLTVFKEIARQFPRSYRAQIGLGAAHLSRDEYDEALNAFNRAIEFNQRSADAWHNMGLVLTEMKDWKQARSAFERALELRPDSHDDLVQLAKVAIEEGDFAFAGAKLALIRNQFPERLEPLYWSGMLAANQRDVSGAIAWFDRLIKLEESYGLAHLQRAKLLSQLGEREAAIKGFGRACELLPESFEAYYFLAALLVEQDAENALPYLTRAYELSGAGDQRAALHRLLADRLSSETAQLLSLADTSESRADIVAALDWIERCIASGELGPLAARVHYNHGRYLESLGRLEESVVAYRQCIDVQADSFWAIHNLGLVLMVHLQRPEEASPYLHQALELLPTSVAVPLEMRASVQTTLEGALRAGTELSGQRVPDDS